VNNLKNQGECGKTPRRDGSGNGVGNRKGTSRTSNHIQGECGKTPRRDGSGNGVGNKKS